MAFTLVATAGASNANSFLTLAEAQDIVDAHTPVTEWDSADQEALLVMATRVIVAFFSGRKVFVDGASPYYLTFPTWTGLVASTTQSLPWPRSGMFDINGNAILSSVLPLELKQATVELALALAREDVTLDNDAAVKGITSVRAGSVAVTFKNDGIMTSKMLPDAVLLYLVPSWYTDFVRSSLGAFDFEVMP